MKAPQTERAQRRRAGRATMRARFSEAACPTHEAPISVGLPGGWHRFRCGCEATS